MISEANNDPTFMKRVITGDETWTYEFGTATSQQLSEWQFEDGPKPTKQNTKRAKDHLLVTHY